MIEYMLHNPMTGVKYIVMIILAVIIFFWYRSISTNKGRVFGNAKVEKGLKRDFMTIGEEHFDPERDDYLLTVGMCLHIQTQLEKEKQPNEAFKKLPAEKQYAMTLGYVFEDTRASLSNYFRSNGEPLLSASMNAVSEVIGGEYAELFRKEYDMFNENNEDVSVIENDVRAVDEKFKELMKNEDKAVYKLAADYIRENKGKFLS